MAEVKKEKQHINIHIYDLDISIKVDADQEPLYREAASLINDRVNAYFSVWKSGSERYEDGRCEHQL